MRVVIFCLLLAMALPGIRPSPLSAQAIGSVGHTEVSIEAGTVRIGERYPQNTGVFLNPSEALALVHGMRRLDELARLAGSEPYITLRYRWVEVVRGQSITTEIFIRHQSGALFTLSWFDRSKFRLIEGAEIDLAGWMQLADLIEKAAKDIKR